MSLMPFQSNSQTNGRRRLDHGLHYGILLAVSLFLANSTTVQVAFVQVAFDVGEDSSDDAEQADTAEAVVNRHRQRRSSAAAVVASVALGDTIRASGLARSLNTRRLGPGTAMSAAHVALLC